MNKINKICNMTSVEEILIQTIEEQAELIQAICKVIRSQYFDKRIDEDVAMENLVEEVADAQLMITLLMQKIMDEDEKTDVCQTEISKAERYIRRLEERLHA